MSLIVAAMGGLCAEAIFAGEDGSTSTSGPDPQLCLGVIGAGTWDSDSWNLTTFQ